MKSKEEIIKRLENYKTNFELAKRGRLNGAKRYIRDMIVELEWVLK